MNKKKKDQLKKAGFMLISTTAGAFTGSVVGRPSALIGLATAGLGAYYLGNEKNRDYIISLGAGMLVGHGYDFSSSQNNKEKQAGNETNGLGIPTTMAGFRALGEVGKSRGKNFLEVLKKKSYVDEISPEKKDNSNSTNGLGQSEEYLVDNQMLSDEEMNNLLDRARKVQNKSQNGADMGTPDKNDFKNLLNGNTDKKAFENIMNGNLGNPDKSSFNKIGLGEGNKEMSMEEALSS